MDYFIDFRGSFDFSTVKIKNMKPELSVIRHQVLSSIIGLALLATLPGCFQHYYKTQTRTQVDAAVVDSLQRQNRYFILHLSDSIVGLANIQVKDDTLHGIVEVLPSIHSRNLSPEGQKGNRIKKSDEANAYTEVHLYAGQNHDKANVNLALPLSSISRLDVYAEDRKTTSTSRTLSLIGIALAAGTAAFVVIVGTWDLSSW
jgi:hypothetical protein